jgi:hypothetical protein
MEQALKARIRIRRKPWAYPLEEFMRMHRSLTKATIGEEVALKLLVLHVLA